MQARVSRPAVTVVVPTRDRAERLTTCLGSLRAALRVGDELIVVDSASVDAPGIATVAAEAGARLIRLERPGVSRARNAGWRAASHDVVLFTDDDVVVDRGWVDGLSPALADEQVGFVTGRILPPPGQQPSRDVAIKRDEQPACYDRRSVGNLGHGASMGMRRSVLERIDGWDEALGTGGRFGAAPEADVFDRCFAAGLIGRYEPTALARHDQWRGPRRLMLLDTRYGYGTGARLAKLWRTDRPRARRVARDVVRWCWEELRDGVRAGHGYPAIGAAARLAAIPVGAVSGLFIPVVDGHYRPRRRP